MAVWGLMSRVSRASADKETVIEFAKGILSTKLAQGHVTTVLSRCMPNVLCFLRNHRHLRERLFEGNAMLHALRGAVSVQHVAAGVVLAHLTSEGAAGAAEALAASPGVDE